MRNPVDHIIRPNLPWRQDSGKITECGYDATKVTVITREQYFKRRKDLGQQRCAMMTCMTCSQTAERHPAWEEDPRLAIRREIEWESGWRHDKNGHRLRDELIAIETLIETHRSDFDLIMEYNLRRKDWLDRKAALKIITKKK